MTRFYKLRAIAGVEAIEGDAYRRSARIGGRAALLEVRHEPATSQLVATIESAVPDLADEAAVRLRRMFDLDVDTAAIAAHLSRDPFLAPLVASRPAIRVPSHWDPFETAMRAVLGQQVTLVAAAQLGARLVERAGSMFADPAAGRPYRLFPGPEEVLAADLSNMGMPGARARTLKAVAEAVLANPGLLHRTASIEETVKQLCAIKGVGPWTAQYIALRACGEPDAFPAGDVGLLRAAADAAGRRPTAEDLIARAEAWRPWRAYAAHHLWAADTDKLVGCVPAQRGRRS